MGRGRHATELGIPLHRTGRSWLRHCATNRKVAGSIPDGVIGVSH
jgi:hypothetical protein